MGSVGIGKDRLSAVDFFGTMMVDTNSDDDFIGFVFSYQDSSNFYVVYSAKHGQRSRWTKLRQGPWRIVRVNSKTGPSRFLGDLNYGGLKNFIYYILRKLGKVRNGSLLPKLF